MLSVPWELGDYSSEVQTPGFICITHRPSGNSKNERPGSIVCLMARYRANQGVVGNCGDCQGICNQPPVIPLHH